MRPGSPGRRPHDIGSERVWRRPARASFGASNIAYWCRCPYRYGVTFLSFCEPSPIAPFAPPATVSSSRTLVCRRRRDASRTAALQQHEGTWVLSAASWLRRNVVYPLWVAKDRSPRLTYLRELERTQYLEPAQLRELQVRKLLETIEHAYREAPYYTRLFDSLGLKPT